MKYIKLFENFNKSGLEKKLVQFINSYCVLSEYSISNYIINDDGTVDIDGDVYLYNERLKKIPFKFGKVSGNFDVSKNYLESLEGTPYYVGGYFDCSRNLLETLKYSPIEVDGNFSCFDNKLVSLEGMSLEIGGDFSCYENINLMNLDSVSNIEGDIYCDKDIDISKFRGYCKNINEI